MNAIAATGMDQASLLAAFTLPMANAAPAVIPVTPVFANLISLMLSTQTALPPSSLKTAASFQGTAASPVQIADAMIRSMLGRPSTTASTASENLSSILAAPPNASENEPPPAAAQNANPTQLSVAIPTLCDPLMAPTTAVPQAPVITADPSVTASAPDDAQVQIPSAAGNANPPAPGTTNANQATARKQPRSATDALMATVITPVATMPALPTAVTPPPADPESNAPAPPMPLPATGDSKASVVTLPLANNSAAAKVAFTAILTPAEAPAPSASAAGPAMPTPGPAGAGNSSTPAALTTVPQPAAQLTTAANPQPPAATASQLMAAQVSSAQAGGNAQPDGDAPDHQENDSPETPARPTVLATATKVKPDVQPDDNGLQQAAAATPGVAHIVAAPSFASSPTDPTRTGAPAPATTPYNTTAEALRTTESNLAAAPALRTGAAQEITIRIATPDSPAVDLRVVERAGQVHVDVRTSDSTLQTSLRQDLGTLTNSLERAGYHAETFTPSSNLGRAASNAQTSNQDGNRGNQQDPSQNRGGSGDFSGRRQQQQKRSGTWLEELEQQS